MKFFLSCLLTIFFLSCEKKINTKKPSNLTTINVDLKKEPISGDFNEYFSSSKVIALETTEESLIAEITKIIAFDKRYFILDRESNSIFIFNENGKYLQKIKRIGTGPHEYLAIKSFTIDKANKHILIYAHKPYKLLIFDFEGKLVATKSMDNLYDDMAYVDDKLILTNGDIGSNSFLLSYDPLTENYKELSNKSDLDYYFEDSGSANSYLISDKNLHLNLPYSDTIYEYQQKRFIPKFVVDFGKNKMPNIFDKKKKFGDYLNFAMEKNFGFGVVDFKEYKDYIVFMYHTRRRMVFYSKKSKEAKVIRNFKKDELFFSNYFGHCGDDNKLISIYPTLLFKKQMSIYKKSEKWKKIPEAIKVLDEKTTDFDNPLMIIYRFK